FPSASGILGVQMQSVGEVMALGRSFPEALQKAFRSLEVGLDGLEPKPPAEGDPEASRARPLDLSRLQFPTAFRLLKLVQAFREALTVKEAYERTGIDPWFLDQIHRLATLPPPNRNEPEIRERKQAGFSDRQLARMFHKTESEFREWRKSQGIVPAFKVVDTCAAEFQAHTPYCYSTYEEENEVAPLPGKKVIILGGGPNRIGQGIEFDTCCVQAVFGLKALGVKTIMVNCNPETVSTDFDLADRLYFEPVTLEDVLNIVELEQPDGVLIQFGGQTPLKIARELERAGVPIAGTSPDQIDRAEDRRRFGEVVRKLGIRVPEFGSGSSLDEVVAIAERIGYPVLARPSYVLGGRAMEIVYSTDQLVDYIARSAEVTAGHPILVDQFLEDAFEFDVDALGDGNNVIIAGILQHIEEAGIHSGDSACVLPPYRITPEALKTIRRHTRSLALELEVRGLINIQFAYQGGKVYVLEANPRASRTVPFISKARGIPVARIAAQLALGTSLTEYSLPDTDNFPLIAVKEAVLPFNKFPREKIFLGPEMKSTGEVLGMAPTLGSAFKKALSGAGVALPRAGCVFLSVNDHDKLNIIPLARDFLELGFSLTATTGTAAALRQNGLQADTVLTVGEGRPHVADRMKNGDIQLVVNTPMGSRSRADEEAIGQAAVRCGVPVFTTLSAAQAAIRALRSPSQPEVRALQDYLDRENNTGFSCG
ncbi:MAG: carbamoyl-phosphate synthase large subunit, partial [Fidelibacterota bacterium]